MKSTASLKAGLISILKSSASPNKNTGEDTKIASLKKVYSSKSDIVEIIKRECESCDLKELVLKFIPEVIGKEIEKSCSGIYPLQNVYLRKVKMLKTPKFDVTKLMEVHGDYSGEEVGQQIPRAEEAKPEAAAAEE